MSDTNNITQPATPPSAPDAPAPAAPTAPPPASPPTGKLHTLSNASFSEIKRKSADRGKLELARELGFKTVEEMKEAHARRQRRDASPAQGMRTERSPAPRTEARPATTETAPPAGEGQPSRRDIRRQREEADKRALLARKASHAEKKNRQLSRDLELERARAEIRVAAIRHGATDDEFVVYIVEKQLSGMTRDEIIAGFDEAAVFSKLKAERPHLFAQRPEVKPANTGPADAPPPPAPPDQVAGATGQAAVFDARKATPQQVQDRLRQLGIHSSATAGSSPGG